MPVTLLPTEPDATRFSQRAALERRSALRDRRPRAVRRHTTRVATRFLILLVGDLAAILIARAVLNWAEMAGTVSPVLAALTPLGRGPRSFALFLISALFALFVTGSHSRHRVLNQPIRLLFAALLAPLPLIAPLVMRADLGSAMAPVGLSMILVWISVLALRQVSERILSQVWPRQLGTGAALLVGKPPVLGEVVERAIAAPGGDFRVVGHVSTTASDEPDAAGSLHDLPRLLEELEVEAVVICAELPEEHNTAVVAECLDAGCQILYPARAVFVGGARPTLVWHHDQPFFEVGSPVLKAKAVIVKRITDVVSSAILLVLLAPVLAIIALAIKLDSPGLALFKQDRAGMGGRRFRMLKFRTMCVDADSQKMDLAHLNRTGDARFFKIENDPRTTRFGRLLRQWSLDELPQLWNVLIGDMSLVGPRPFFESDFESYEHHHFRRLDAKPGITGLWQVSGRSELLDFEDVIFLDRQYIEQWSFWLDVSILFRTVPAVLRRTGAY